MKVFLVRNSCVLTEAIVCGYDTAEEALAIVRKDFAKNNSWVDIVTNYDVKEVTEPSIIYRDIEEDE